MVDFEGPNIPMSEEFRKYIEDKLDGKFSPNQLTHLVRIQITKQHILQYGTRTLFMPQDAYREILDGNPKIKEAQILAEMLDDKNL